MKNLITSIASIAAATVLFAGQAIANPEFDNHANYGSVLQDTVAAQGGAYQPTGHLVAAVNSSDSYGSALFDLDQPGNMASSQPSIGDSADDFGSILYDTGSIY